MENTKRLRTNASVFVTVSHITQGGTSIEQQSQRKHCDKQRNNSTKNR